VTTGDAGPATEAATGAVAGVSTDAAPARIVGPDGRAKAYRPLPVTARREAIEAGLGAYDRGEYFLAHEELAPAWMGTADPGERALLQGLIKVAAAYVHKARGNPRGIERNLVGARERLSLPGVAEATAAVDDLDVERLLADVDRRLAELAVRDDRPLLEAPVLHRRRD